MTTNIFVFGSNLQGIHRRGAARTAMDFYHAEYGKGEGLQGECYALPTKRTPWESLNIEEVSLYVQRFLDFASKNYPLSFKVTRVGCGLAGFIDAEIAPLFYYSPYNCFFDPLWAEKYGYRKWTEEMKQMQ